MPRKQKKQALAPVVAVASKPGHYDQQQIINLMSQGKSVTEIAAAIGCSPVYARRVLSTKAPEQYKAYVAGHRVGTPQTTAVVPANGGKVVAAGQAIAREMLTAAQAIEVIAKSVSQAAFGEAQVVSQPQTRAELYSNISKGVRAGIKKLGIGFHA